MIQFSDWQSFVAMGGYGLFVWLSFGAFVLLLIGTLLGLKWQRRSIVKAIRAEQHRRQRIEAAKGLK